VSKIDSTLESIDEAIRVFESDLMKAENLEREIKKKQETVAKLIEQMTLLEEVRVFLQELAEVARHEIASGLEQVVTLCLQAVFGETMSFEIEINTSRNATSIQFYVVNIDGEEAVRFTPEESMGGGVVDTVSIGLRFGMLKILNPQPTGPIILDEPAKMVSADLIDSIAALLQELTRMFEKQNILVTHHTSLMDVVDNAIYFEKVDGISKTSSLKDSR
jgi:DNA repair exonuclease SbcCD ATPase subunit